MNASNGPIDVAAEGQSPGGAGSRPSDQAVAWN